jgi:hypothetical protein
VRESIAVAAIDTEPAPHTIGVAPLHLMDSTHG